MINSIETNHFNKLTYVPLEVLNDQTESDTLNSDSQTHSDSSSLNNIQKIYDLEVNNKNNFAGSSLSTNKSNSSNNHPNETYSDTAFGYTYLDNQRTQALKSTLIKLNKYF